MPRILLAAIALVAATANAQPFYLPPGEDTGLPRVVANDNRTPAGTLEGNVLTLDLQVVEADFRPETDAGPGIRLFAVRESGKSPQIPAPLIRVESGTRVRVRVTNAHPDSTISVFGFYTRPNIGNDSLVVAPGESATVEFDAGTPGTYLYGIRPGFPPPLEIEREQMIGAFIVDPPGGSPPDRVLVMNIWSQPVESGGNPFDYLEVLTINGKSWPHTERMRPQVGELQRWRVVNGSLRNHPMHLHGFFFDVTNVGGLRESAGYSDRDRRPAVTEFMRGLTTMDIEWTPTRPGRWLFHCHLSFHVAPFLRLPGAADFDAPGEHPHMSGLVVGIDIPPGPTDLVETHEPAYRTLRAIEYADTDSTHRYAFSFDPAYTPDSTRRTSPGPLFLMRLHQPTWVTVRNELSVPTGVHWHGLELDAWSDGVPGWSASDGKTSPVIQPDSSFTYKLSGMRAGTFIYHSHMNDIDQLTKGLYGPLIVLGPDDMFDPDTDHVYTVGWRTDDPRGPADLELNGSLEQPDQIARVGETHRLRVIHIAPAGNIRVRMTRNDEPIPIVPIAKDGADLPAHQQVPIEQSTRFGVGETADFAFTPAVAGEYTLRIGFPRFEWTQTWIVRDE